MTQLSFIKLNRCDPSLLCWLSKLSFFASGHHRSKAQLKPIKPCQYANVNFEVGLPCVSVILCCMFSKPLWQEIVWNSYIKIQTRQNLRQEKRVFHVSSWKSSNPVEATRPVLHHGFSSGNQCTPEWNGNLDHWDGGMWPRRLVKIDVLIPPLTNMQASKSCCWVVDSLLFESTWSVRISWKLEYCARFKSFVMFCHVLSMLPL